MHAYLLSGGDRVKRQDYIEGKLKVWGISSFDTVILSGEENSITIAAVRDFQKRLLLLPFTSPYTAGIISQAHKLTVEAQNALLKTLEEPPPHARILLETDNASVLLPTIISRCQPVDLGPPDAGDETRMKNIDTLLQQVLSADTGNRLRILEQALHTREDTQHFVDDAIGFLRSCITEQAKPVSKDNKDRITVSASDAATLLRRFLTAKKQLTANVNYRLVGDHIFLSVTPGQASNDIVE